MQTQNSYSIINNTFQIIKKYISFKSRLGDFEPRPSFNFSFVHIKLQEKQIVEFMDLGMLFFGNISIFGLYLI